MAALALSNIQGNILGSFNKDFQTFVFLQFRNAAAARAWIAEITGPDNAMGVAQSNSEEVLRFNGQFKALRAEGKTPEHFIEAEWTNLSLSFQGLTTLGISATDLARFPQAFRLGIAKRAAIIGDTGPSAPNHWIAPFGTNVVHALMLIAADSATKLTARLTAIRGTAAFAAGVTIVQTIEGRTRMDIPKQAGHEHFGFKDGISQPGIRGITRPDDPVANPDQGHPGQDLLWPGEFVLGYPTQIPTAKAGVDGPNPDPGPISHSGPTWTKDGSYLVFRRLAQDVPGFRAHVTAIATAHGLHPDLAGAKLVGRYQSGCPVEKRAFQPEPFVPSPRDPEIATPGLADSDTLNNNFEFADDAIGEVCPLGAHIRKAYPRDETTPAGAANSESNTQTHRLLRRGIPFGPSFGASHGGGANVPRGLIFQCYQKSLEDQFEFVTQSWINNATFPPGAAGGVPGEDPVIAQSTHGPFQLTANQPAINVQHFVKMTGGEYFFTPSIDTLQKIGNNAI